LKTKKPFILHPILWALFPPLALLGDNISHITPVNVLRTILVILILTLVLWVLFRILMRRWDKAAVIVTGFLVLFFSYGHIYNLIQNRMILGINVGRHRILFPLFILAWVVIIAWVSRLKTINGLTSALNLIGILVLIFPSYQIISHEARTSTKSVSAPNESIQSEVAGLVTPSGNYLRDIYYIILDTYTRADTLSKYFSYDNSSFINALESRGFYVAGCSQSNYSFTTLSLATSLNFNYPQVLNESLTPTNKNGSDIYPYIYENAAAFALRNLGYRFEAIDSGFSPTEITGADVYYTPEDDWRRLILGDGINSFESMEINTSAGMLLYEFNTYLPKSIRNFLSAYVLHRERILYALDVLDGLGATPGPKFVFVHILAPHNPFVFGPNGENIERKTPFTLNDDRDVVTMEDYVAGYRDQIIYLNRRILAIVDSLIQNSEQAPIIVIQGDHGTSRIPEWQDTILNAYYLPDSADTGLYQSISPINTFRVIFNTYFSGHLPLLPDQACTTNDNGDPYSCVPVPEPDPQCTASNGSQNP
jgi:hypothetical protein